MTSENLTAVGRTVVAQAQELKGTIRRLMDETDGHSWAGLLAAFSAIKGDIERLFEVAHLVPLEHRMPRRKDSS